MNVPGVIDKLLISYRSPKFSPCGQQSPHDHHFVSDSFCRCHAARLLRTDAIARRLLWTMPSPASDPPALVPPPPGAASDLQWPWPVLPAPLPARPGTAQLTPASPSPAQPGITHLVSAPWPEPITTPPALDSLADHREGSGMPPAPCSWTRATTASPSGEGELSKIHRSATNGLRNIARIQFFSVAPIWVKCSQF
jgi:hypothetical protein